MGINLTSAQQDAIESGNVRIAFFYEAEYSNDYVRAWTGFEDKSFDSDGDGNDETFKGVGKFGQIGNVSETNEIRAEGFTVQLSGVPVDDNSDALDDALREDYHGKDATLWIGLLDENFDIIDDPILMNQGFQDQQKPSDSGSELTITVAIENPLRNLRRKATLHYTREDQQIDHPNDRFLDHVEDIQDKKEQWGSNL
jgi:hypothetical protein